jgi:peptidoglycan-associated lipoprotein
MTMRRICNVLTILLAVAVLATGCATKVADVRSEQVQTAPESAPVSQSSPGEASLTKGPDAVETRNDAVATLNDAQPKGESAAVSPFDKIYFDFDSYKLTPSARDVVQQNFEKMRQDTNTRFELQGHCDENGSEEYNLALGEVRAKAVYSYLVNLGIDGSRLSLISYGKERPIDPGHTEYAWAKNRRVEFAYIGL